MAGSMGPPLLPAYSLRVKLFKAAGPGDGDKALRCFRVVTSPESTVREFCQAASRYHEINYGEPISVRKVQDDQEFDITQNEVLGSLFENGSIIRMIKEANRPGIRDSLPPESALRFEYGGSRKRVREESAQPDHSTTNKRQRILDLDPDQPLPSRETETNGRRSSFTTVPNSQEGSRPITSNRYHDQSRYARRSHPRIPETPSPPPSSGKAASENGADLRYSQPTTNIGNEESDFTDVASQTDRYTPSRGTAEPKAHPELKPSLQNKNASYHISRPGERGTSVSTAATSPFSMDHQGPAQQSAATSSKLKRPEPTLPHKRSQSKRPLDETSIYDTIISEDEAPAIEKAKKATLKAKSSPGVGLPGLDWAKKRVRTPSQGNSRSPGIRDPVTTPGELPLTPNSKIIEDKIKENKNARKAGIAAVEAAERRKVQADEARQVAEAQTAIEERANREEQEHLEVEEFNRGEAERKAALAKAERLRKESEARAKAETIEQQRLEADKAAKEKADQQRVEKVQAAAAAEAKKAQDEAAEKRLHSSPPALLRSLKSSSPILPRSSPFSRGHLGTPFIPPRKSALKNTASSQGIRSSSPAVYEASFQGVSIESQMPLPKTVGRRVSFQKEVIQKDATEKQVVHKEDKSGDTPIQKSTTPILPPQRMYSSQASTITPKKSSKQSKPGSVPNAKTPIAKTSPAKKFAAKTEDLKTTVEPTRSQTPSTAILPPKRQSLDRSVTPTSTARIVPPGRVSSISKSSKSSSTATAKKVSPPLDSQNRKASPNLKDSASAMATKNIARPAPLDLNNETPVHVPVGKGKNNVGAAKLSCLQASNHADPSSNDVEMTDIPHAAQGTGISANSREREDKSEDSESSDDDDSNSKIRQIVQIQTPIQHATSKDLGALIPPSSKEQLPKEGKDDSSNSSSDSEESSDEEMEDAVEVQVVSPKHNSKAPGIVNGTNDSSESSSDSDSAAVSDDSKDHETQVSKSSPPLFPLHKQTALKAASKSNNQQLTSSLLEANTSFGPTSTPTPVPKSSATVRPPTMRFGASLSSLNQNKPALGGSSLSKPAIMRNGQSQIKSLGATDDESEESESEDSDSSSDDESDTPAAKDPASAISSAVSRKVKDSDDSSSDSSDNDDEESQKTKAREELASQLAALESGSQGSSVFPSSKNYSLGTQPSPTTVGKEKKATKKPDKYLFGYRFAAVR